MHENTPVPSFTEAIFALLERFADALKLRGAPEHSVRAYIFGGCAVHLYAASRVSSDLDVELSSVVVSTGDLLAAKEEAGYVLVQGSPSEEPDLLELDLTYNTTLGPLHEDFDTRARLLEAKPGSPVAVLLPGPEDLALTKLARLTEADIADILTVMEFPGASWDVLARLTADVEKYYPCVPDDLTNKLNYLIKHRRGSAS